MFPCLFTLEEAINSIAILQHLSNTEVSLRIFLSFDFSLGKEDEVEMREEKRAGEEEEEKVIIHMYKC